MTGGGICTYFIGHIRRFEKAGINYLQICYFVHLFIGDTVWRSTSSPPRAPWALGKPTGRANIMTIIIAACTRLWRNHESITFYEVRSHWWWSIRIAWWEWLLEGSCLCVFPAECTSGSLSIGMFGGNAQAVIQYFRYCSVLQNFKTILMFPCTIRPQSSFVNTRGSITGAIVTKSHASDSDV